MFSKFFYVLLVSLLIMSFFACSKSDDTSSGQLARSADQVTDSTVEEVPQYTGNIRVTNVENYGRYAKKITLNNMIEIIDVRVRDGRDGKFAAFPRRDNRWDYVTVVDRSLSPLLLNAVENGVIDEVDEDATLEITDIKINKQDRGSLKAYVEVLIDNTLWLKSLQLREGQRGLWLAYPRREKEFEPDKGEWENIVNVNNPLRQQILDKVIEEYNKM